MAFAAVLTLDLAANHRVAIGGWPPVQVVRHAAAMSLEGWNHIPRGYSAQFDVEDAPPWLRLWAKTPFVDRYAYPRLVVRGHAFLIPHPHYAPADKEVPGPGWRFRPAGYDPPGSAYGLRAAE